MCRSTGGDVTGSLDDALSHLDEGSVCSKDGDRGWENEERKAGSMKVGCKNIGRDMNANTGASYSTSRDVHKSAGMTS